MIQVPIECGKTNTMIAYKFVIQKSIVIKNFNDKLEGL